MSAPRLALITGGVRRLGAAIAGRLAGEGYALALHGNSDAVPEAALADILRESGCAWHGFEQDFANRGAAEELMEQVARHFGRAPDLLVNSASIFGQSAALETGQDEFERHLRINLTVPTLLATALARLRADGDRAHIVHIVDQRVRNPNCDQFAYTISKQALSESISTLALACAGRLRVNGVAPGLTLTKGEYGEGQLERIAQDMPVGRLSTPEDIARAVLYIDRADAVSGQLLYVDGGAHLKSFERDFVNMHDMMR